MPSLSLFYFIPLIVAFGALLWLTCTRWTAFRPLHRLLAKQQHPVVQKSSEQHTLSRYNIEQPLLSIVVPCVGEAHWVERHLAHWLEQQQEHYEVIIADASDDEGATQALVKRAQTTAPHLRYTQLPPTTRNLDKRQAVLVLGIRSARAPWIVLTQADCQPSSPQWLSNLYAHCAEDKDLVLGRIDFDDLGSECLRTSYEQQRRLALQATCTLRGRACGGDARCLVLRKSWWLSSRGFVEGRSLGYGECALLVDRHAEADRVAFAFEATSAVRQNIPEGQALKAQRKEAQAIRRQLHTKHAWTFLADRLSSGAWMLFGWAFLAFILLRIGNFGAAHLPQLATWNLPFPPTPVHYTWLDLCYDLPAFLLLIWAILGTIFSTRRTMQLLLPDYRGWSILYPLLFDTLLPFRRTL